jgi:hypothetical protein
LAYFQIILLIVSVTATFSSFSAFQAEKAILSKSGRHKII